MRYVAKVPILLLGLTTVFAQTASETSVERVLSFRDGETTADVQEAATTICNITDTKQQPASGENWRAVTLRGTASEIAEADWLFQQLTQSGSVENPEYHVAGDSGESVRVFILKNVQNPIELQETATAVRSIGNIRGLFIYNKAHLVVVRGTSDQIALAAWMFHELDQSAQGSEAGAVHEYSAPDGSNDRVRIFFLAHPGPPQELQEAVTLARTLGGMRRLFPDGSLGAVVVRGTGDEIALTAWLLGELDKPAGPADTATHEYEIPEGTDDAIHVFYLPEATVVKDVHLAVSDIRTNANTQRVGFYDRLRAIAIRGTAEQAAIAERVIAGQKP